MKECEAKLKLKTFKYGRYLVFNNTNNSEVGLHS